MIFSDARTDQGPLPVSLHPNVDLVANTAQSTNWWSWDTMGLGNDMSNQFTTNGNMQ